MKSNDAVILIAEDDAGHYELVKRNLWRSCVEHEMFHFKNGQELLDFLYGKADEVGHDNECRYFILLDIRMPKVDGVEVLRRLKEDKRLRKIPVIMLTTTDADAEVDRCYKMGCSFYMVKPPDYGLFMKAVENLGKFLSLRQIIVPPIGNGDA